MCAANKTLIATGPGRSIEERSYSVNICKLVICLGQLDSIILILILQGLK